MVTALFCTLESMNAYLFYSLYKLNLKAQSKSDLNHCTYSLWQVNFRSVSTMILSFPGTWHFQSHCPDSSISLLCQGTHIIFVGPTTTKSWQSGQCPTSALPYPNLIFTVMLSISKLHFHFLLSSKLHFLSNLTEERLSYLYWSTITFWHNHILKQGVVLWLFVFYFCWETVFDRRNRVLLSSPGWSWT